MNLNEAARILFVESPRLIQKAKETLGGFTKTLEEKGWEVDEVHEHDPNDREQMFSITGKKQGHRDMFSSMVQIFITVRSRLTRGERASSSISVQVLKGSRWEKVKMEDFWYYVNGVESEEDHKANKEKQWRAAHRRGQVSDEELADVLKNLGI